MVIFHGYVKLPEGKSHMFAGEITIFATEIQAFSTGPAVPGPGRVPWVSEDLLHQQRVDLLRLVQPEAKEVTGSDWRGISGGFMEDVMVIPIGFHGDSHGMLMGF